MRTIATIAQNTFRQMIRDKILYGIIVFAMLFIGSTAVIGSLALEENIFIIKNLGLAGIYIFGLIITTFLGASLIYDEIENRTTHILLAKPVTRTDIIIGKFLGLVTSIGLTILLMGGTYATMVLANGGTVGIWLLAALVLQWLEMSLLTVILILFSTLTTPLATIIYTIVIVYIGHLLDLLLEYAARASGLAKIILTSLYYLLPNLEKFDIRSRAVHNIPIPQGELIASAAYAVACILFVIYITKIIFDRKNL